MGCFGAVSVCLTILAAISYYASQAPNFRGDENEETVLLSRGIRILVYLITTVLAVTSSAFTLIDVGDDWDKTVIVPVSLYSVSTHIMDTLMFYSNQ